MNKKGQTGMGKIVLFALVTIGLLAGGLFMSTIVAVIGIASDGILPQISEVGSEANINDKGYFVKATSLTQQTINSLPWMLGGLYAISLVGLIGLSFVFRISGQKILVVFFFAVALLLIVGSIMISQIYEDFHTGGDDIALKLQENVLMSFLMIYSPVIFTIIIFISGAIMFSGFEEVPV